MKIYTKTGDDGTTGLLGPNRVRKDHHRIEAYGTVDELNAVLGIARSLEIGTIADALLVRIQNDLFGVGAALADPNPSGPFYSSIASEHVEFLEREIDRLEAGLPKLSKFILPGGSLGASQIHLARTVCRRAERLVVGLDAAPEESVAREIVVYLNRLSDALFVLARFVNQEHNIPDITWEGVGR